MGIRVGCRLPVLMSPTVAGWLAAESSFGCLWRSVLVGKDWLELMGEWRPDHTLPGRGSER